MKPKILCIIQELNYGGAPKIMAFLANKLALDEFEVFLLTYENSNAFQKLSSEVKHIYFSPSSRSIFAIRRVQQILKVRNVIRQIKPDVIISFLIYPNIISIIASKGLKSKIIISERGDPNELHGWFPKLRDFIYNFADGYVFQTAAAKNYFNQHIQKNAVVIPNPAYISKIPEKWRGIRENSIVHVGRFELLQKRQDLLIHAFKKIANKYPDLKLIFFGDGDDEQQIKKCAVEAGLSDRIIFAGCVENIPEVIKKAKIFVLPSDHEGFPNALIEAMSIGLPCIATNSPPGAVAELIRNMENGILVNTNDVEALANAMELVLSNPDFAEHISENALKINTELDPELIISLWKNLIYRLIKPD
jgi:glycosyltransferase involved in cell wall biosynthesis